MMVYKCVIVLFLYVSPIYSWNNWAGNQSCDPLQILYPKTAEQLYSYVKTASLSHHKIRVAGAGYSYSDCVYTHGIMLNLHHLNNILAYDKNTSTVKVEAGITLKELNAQLVQCDLALCNQAAIDTITLGGAISTATHGTGYTGDFQW